MPATKLPPDHTVTLFSLVSGRPLLERVCQHLGIPACQHEEREFEDGETKLRPMESVRGRDVYVVQSLYGDEELSVNDRLLRTLTFLATLRDAGADRVTAITPYLCYARKDARTKPQDPVTLRYIAALFEAVGLDRILVVDVHNPSAYQNAFRIPAEHLTAAPAFVDSFVSLVGERAVAVVSPDAGGVKRAERFRQALEARLERPVGAAFIEKHRSEEGLRGGAVVGDVKNRAAIIIDDLISSGKTLARAADACLNCGASMTFAAATHGVFSGDASNILEDSKLDRIVILDTISALRLDPKFQERYVEVIDSSPLLAGSIHRLHTNGSLVDLF